MQQYVIIAKDGKDTGALERRMNVRPFHLEYAKKLRTEGQFVLGGALLDEAGQMEGSVMVLQFENEDQLKEYLDAEPYIKDGVWKDIEIKPFKVAVF